MAKNQIDSRARNKVQMITSNARTVIRIAGRVGVVGAPGSRAGSGRRRGGFLRVGCALAFPNFFLLGLSAFAMMFGFARPMPIHLVLDHLARWSFFRRLHSRSQLCPLWGCTESRSRRSLLRLGYAVLAGMAAPQRAAQAAGRQSAARASPKARLAHHGHPRLRGSSSQDDESQ